MAQLVLFWLVSGCVWGQIEPTKYPGLPKYPYQFDSQTTYQGVWPGSRVRDPKQKTAKFQRVESNPAALRLVVRANCSKTIGQRELIDRAQESTMEKGPVVQMDWGRVDGDEDVVFWCVVMTKTRITDVDLEARDGKYKIDQYRVTETPKWEVRRLRFPKLGGACVDEDDLEPMDLKIAIQNLLNEITLKEIRAQKSKTPA